MKITSIEIKHFRGIKKSKVQIDNLCCLVGENNSGKSTVLRALNSFFNFKDEDKYFLSGQNLYSKKSNPQITINFSSENPPSDFSALFNGRNLTITFTYLRSKAKPNYKVKIRRSMNDLSSAQLSSLKDQINFVLVPPVRDHTKILEQEQGVLAELISAYLEKHTKKRDQLSPKVVKNASEIEKGVFQKISSEMENLYFLNNEFKFVLNFKSNIDYKHMIKDYQLQIKDHDKTFLLEDCGSGIQSLTLIALYRYLGKLKGSNYILGIEEPETNLHPQAQRDFVNSIKAGVKDGSGGSIQAIISTHSPVIVDQVSHEEVVLCKRRPDSTRGFNCYLSQISSDFWSSYKIDKAKHYQFYRYKNSEFFFSKHIILCEGKSDVEVVRHLARCINVDLDSLGITLLETGGVGSFKYPISLFTELQMPHTVVVDKDFFLPLKNDMLEESRNSQGFPQYKKEFVSLHLGLIEKVFKTKMARDKLLDLFFSNHSKALNITAASNWIVFKWNLETDLVNSKKAREVYYNLLKITGPNEKNSSNLLSNFKDAIKRPENILNVLDSIEASNMPHSYSRIKKVLLKLSKNCTSHDLI